MRGAARSQRTGHSRTEVLADASPGGHLSEGVVVRGDIGARVFGMRLLQVQADVVLVPAKLRRAEAIRTVASGQPLAVPARSSVPADGGPPRRSGSNRRASLQEADRLLALANASLRRARDAG